MIRLENISKAYRTRTGRHWVFKDVGFTIRRGEKIGILGRNGAGKSTLVRLIGGIEQPTSGRIVGDMSISWPLAFSGAFQHSLTGLDNLKFICRIYDKDPEEAAVAVEEFAELGRYMKEPIKTYSAGMRARLGFGISLAVDFDCFLIDEIVAVGDHGEGEGPRVPRRKPSAPGLAEIADRLSDRLETRVKVDLGKSKGKITVEFASLEDLRRIIDVIDPRNHNDRPI